MSTTTMSTDHLEVRILHPTLSSSKMFLGTIVAGTVPRLDKLNHAPFLVSHSIYVSIEISINFLCLYCSLTFQPNKCKHLIKKYMVDNEDTCLFQIALKTYLFN